MDAFTCRVAVDTPRTETAVPGLAAPAGRDHCARGDHRQPGHGGGRRDLARGRRMRRMAAARYPRLRADFPLDVSRQMFEANRNSMIYLAQHFYDSHGATNFVHSETGLRTLKDEFDKVVLHNQSHLN